MTPDEYCRNKAARVGTPFYYSVLFLPDSQCRAMTAVYAFRQEMASLVDECRETEVAEKKLDWWREEIRNTFLGTPHHPVARALLATLQNFNLPQEYFQEMIDGMHMDLRYHTYPEFSELSLYCYRISGIIGRIYAEILGYEDRHTPRATHNLWMALQLTGFLHALHDDVQRGHTYIPLDEMDSYQVSIADLAKRETPDRVRSLLELQSRRAVDLFRNGLEQLPVVDRYRQLATVIMARLSLTLLNEIEFDGYRILEHRILLTPLRQLWIAWRTRVTEHRLHRRFSAGKQPSKPR